MKHRYQSFILLFLSTGMLFNVSCDLLFKKPPVENPYPDDYSAPIVLSFSPLNFENDVDVNTKVTVVFNETVNSSTVTDQTFYLMDQNNETVQGVVGCSGDTAIFTPNQPLEYETSY